MAFLSDLADDAHFAGLAVVDVTEPLYFSGVGWLGAHGGVERERAER